MPSQADIDAFGNLLAADITTAEKTTPPVAGVLTAEVFEYMIRPHIMKRGFAKAFAAALDPPWVAVEATNSSNPEAAKLAPGWLNYGSGWALAMIRKTPLTGNVELRGYVTTSGSNTLILTLPPALRPAQNELFGVVVDFQPAYINVWVDGTVSVYYAEATTRQVVTLSGISFEAAI